MLLDCIKIFYNTNYISYEVYLILWFMILEEFFLIDFVIFRNAFINCII